MTNCVVGAGGDPRCDGRNTAGCSGCKRQSRYRRQSRGECQQNLVTNIDGGAFLLKQLTAAGQYSG